MEENLDPHLSVVLFSGSLVPTESFLKSCSFIARLIQLHPTSRSSLNGHVSKWNVTPPK